MKYHFAHIIFILFALFFSLPVYAQLSDAQKNTLDAQSKGFDFYFNCGTYLGNKYTANYYNGSSDDISINRVLNNSQLKSQIDNLIATNQNVILDDEGVQLSELPTNMRYNMSFIFGLGFLYHFNRNLSLTMSFSQTKLTTISGVTFTYNTGVSGNERSSILEYSLVGKELRSFFEIGINYMFRSNENILPFFEFAAQLNNVKIKSADLVIENTSFTMIDYYGGAIYDPTMNQTQIDPYLGGIGGGVLSGFGVRIPFTKTIALEPVLQLQYTFINIEVDGLKKMLPNYNFMVRLIVGDKLFAK